MRISQLFDQKKLVLSCEVFPPKPETPVQSIYDTLDALKDLRPDFISVTLSLIHILGSPQKMGKRCSASSRIIPASAPVPPVPAALK